MCLRRYSRGAVGLGLLQRDLLVQHFSLQQKCRTGPFSISKAREEIQVRSLVVLISALLQFAGTPVQ